MANIIISLNKDNVKKKLCFLAIFLEFSNQIRSQGYLFRIFKTLSILQKCQNDNAAEAERQKKKAQNPRFQAIFRGAGNGTRTSPSLALFYL